MKQEDNFSLINVKYKNQIDELGIGAMTGAQLNAFFAILATFKNINPKDPIKTFTFKEFRKLAELPDTYINNNKMEEFLQSILPKITSGSIKLETENYSSVFVLFERIDVDHQNKTISVVMSQSCVQYFNEYLKGSYTSFPLIGVLKLKSKYSKILFKALSRYKYTGRYEMDYDYFIQNVLRTPKSLERFKIANTVVSPAIKELTENGCFENLQVYYSKDPNNGRKIAKICITFKPIAISEQNDEEEIQNDAESFNNFEKILKENNNVDDAKKNKPYKVLYYDYELHDWNYYYEYETLEFAKMNLELIPDKTFKYRIYLESENKEEELVYTNATDEEIAKIEEELKKYEENSLPF